MPQSTPPSRAGRTVVRAVGVGALVLLLLVALAGMGGPVLDAGAQSTAPVTPFPRPIMAFVGADRVAAATAIDPVLAVQSVAVAAGTGVGSDAGRVVTVGFAAPVALPTGAYRVSVVFGDPSGARTRASFVARAGEPTGGTIETSTDGTRWTAAGATDATLDGDSLRITAAVGAADPGQGLWVEAQVGDDAARRSQSPVFSLDALLGRNTAGALPASTVGTLTTGTPTIAEPLAVPGPPPTLTVDTHLTVTETAPVPATLGGQAVVNALDEITFMPGYTPDGTIPAVVQINRTTGAISALRGTTGLPTDQTGDGSWIVQGLPAPPPTPSADAPSTVVLDPEATARALGLPLDPDGLALGLRRKLTLADGTDVITSPTMATLVWYEAASPTGPPETLAPTTTEARTDATTSSSSSTIALVGGVAVVVLLVLGAVVLVVRRRRAAAIDRWLDDFTPAEPREPATATAVASARVRAATVADPRAESRTEGGEDPREPPVVVVVAETEPATTPTADQLDPGEAPTDDTPPPVVTTQPEPATTPTADQPDPVEVVAESTETPTDDTPPPVVTTQPEPATTPTADQPDPVEVVAGPGEMPTIDAPVVVPPPAVDEPAPIEVEHDEIAADPDDHDDDDDGDGDGDGDAPGRDDGGPGRSPADALAFLEAEVSALSERVDRIPDRRDRAPRPPGPPG